MLFVILFYSRLAMAMMKVFATCAWLFMLVVISQERVIRNETFFLCDNSSNESTASERQVSCEVEGGGVMDLVLLFLVVFGCLAGLTCHAPRDEEAGSAVEGAEEHRVA